MESEMNREFLCSDNSHYSNFFVLKLGVYVDGQPMNLNFSDGSLELSVPSQAVNVALSIDSVARDVNEYLKRSGYHGIANRVMYGDNTPLFQVLVNVPTFDTLSLKKLVAHLPKFNKHLEIALQAKLSEPAAVEEKTCEVRAELYLMCPDARMKEVDITLVNDDNAVECLDIWKNSSTFEFDHAFQVMLRDGIKVTPRAANTVEVTLDLLLRELTGVIKWFEFGLELGLAFDELKAIETDYRFVYQCKTRVFGLWLEKKKGSWFEVVKALRCIKMEPLAQRIAEKYEIPWKAVQMESSDASGPDAVQEIKKTRKKPTLQKELTDAKQRLLVEKKNARSLMEEKKKLEKERDELLERIKLLEKEIRTLRGRENTQEIIAEKEEELKEAYKQLEMKEIELRELNREIETTKRRLEETGIEVAENSYRLKKQEKQEANLRADLKVEKLRAYFLMEKAFSYASPPSHNSVESKLEKKLEEERKVVDELTKELATLDKGIADLTQQKSQLQSQIKENGFDLLLPLQLSESCEMITEKEGERKKLRAKQASSSRLVEMMEGLPPQFKAVGDKFPCKSLKVSATQTPWDHCGCSCCVLRIHEE